MLTQDHFIDLGGRVAVVTGAGRGIGAAHAHALADRGAALVLTDLPDHDGASRAQGVVDALTDRGARAIAVAADASDPSSATATVERALEEFGRLDVLVHNAGLTGRSASEQGVSTPPSFSDPDWSGDVRQVEVNLLSAFYLLRAAWPTLVERAYGRVVLTSSGAVFGRPSLGAYGAAKAGLLSLVRAAAIDAEDQGVDIKVNALAPMAATGAEHAEYNERFGGGLDASSCSAAAVLLASSECPVSGACLRVGGGYVASIVLALTNGWTSPDTTITPEALLDAMPKIVDTTDLSVPRSAEALIDAMVERTARRA
jgi:NAD(P)-dependent dehydrogenase (short-subunit alcohol dehydrogenase family)